MTNRAMDDAVSRIRALNRILASRGGRLSEAFLDTSRAIDFAERMGERPSNPAAFAKSVMRMYDPGAHLEYVDLGGDHFDPLFAFGMVSDAAKRLAGCPRPVLVIAGLDRASRGGGRRWSAKRRGEYSENLNVVESVVLRYKNAIPQIEIIFV